MLKFHNSEGISKKRKKVDEYPVIEYNKDIKSKDL